MKKFKIINACVLAIALVLEILPYGGRLNWGNFFFESTSYHSYFDLFLWENGNIGPFFCGILTSLLLLLAIASIFVKTNKFYLFSMCAISLVTTMVSIAPTFQNTYTLVGLVITILLGASAELSIVCYMKNTK